MAKTGRKPKPSSLRLVEGKRGHRPIPKEVQPHPVKGGVSSPVFLSASGKKEWSRVVKGLQSLGLYTMMDRAALATYCQAFGNWQDAQEWINKNGDTYRLRRRRRWTSCGSFRRLALFLFFKGLRDALSCAYLLYMSGLTFTTQSRITGFLF